MKLLSFEWQGRRTWGSFDGEKILDLGAALPAISSLRDLFEQDALGQVEIAARTAPERLLASVSLLPVIPDPRKIVCCGLNYDEHRVESHNPVLGHPTLFVRWPDTQVAHGADIAHPPETAMLDYEAELAVVIGRGGRHIAVADAMAHVAGFACYNDISARDWQKHSSQMTPGKNFPGTGPFGPWLVTPDEVGELAPLRIQGRLNGEIVQDAKLGDMIFDVPALIAYISTFTELSAGDVILTGTPGGVGFRRQPQLFLKAGDLVEVEIERVGLLTNRIV